MDLSSRSHSTLAAPREPAPADPLCAYEQRFGALPGWLDETSLAAARSLALLSLRRGAPLSPADDFFQPGNGG